MKNQSEKDKRFYVYIHRRKSDGQIFYVGKGSGNRCKQNINRSAWWSNVKKKHGISREIILSGMSETCALTYEKIAIHLCKLAGHPIVNLTMGGDGVSGYRHTEESRRKMSENSNPNPWLRGREVPDWLKEIYRNAKIGKKQSEEHAQKSRIAKKGKRQPVEAIDYVMGFRRVKIRNGEGREFRSVRDAARWVSEVYGVNGSQGNISMVLTGRRKTAYGHTWHYSDDNKESFL